MQMQMHTRKRGKVSTQVHLSGGGRGWVLVFVSFSEIFGSILPFFGVSVHFYVYV